MTLWDRILSSLQGKVNSQSFNTWLRPTQQLSAADGLLQVEVPSPLFADFIHKNYLPLIQESARELAAGDLQLHFTSRDLGLVRRPPGPQGTPARSAPPREPGREPARGPAALAVAEQPSSAYNPLFVYGGVGLGKTHLMHAVGNRIGRSFPGMRLLYISAETFMNELINAIRFEKTLDFKDRYRSVDVLLIDDIQFLAGKERTQEEFFHTFNALYESQKQIVSTSDCPPRDIPTLEERLRSRFEWGLIADIQPPDLETKVAILRKKAEAENLDLPEDVALFIASRVRSNIRELEGSLIRLIAFSSLSGRRIDIDMARETLKDLIDDRGRSVTVEAIQKLVAAHYRIKITELKSRNNSKHIAFPRQVAMYLCKQLTDKSLPALGELFGGKHHTTVIHAIRKIEGMRGKDRDFDGVVAGFLESFK
jgi:chromosomal replication initiator protein